MKSILNSAKKEATPPKKLQEKKQRIAKKASDLALMKGYSEISDYLED